ncbi:SigE family RNA polymerase sigma factor [Nocardioides kongjuensis]
MDGGADDPVRRCFDASYRRLVGQMYGVCGSLAEAEEVVAEAFARAVASRRTFERVEQPEAWLRTVAVNVARTRRRRSVLGQRLTHGRAEQPVARDAELSEERLVLVAALRTLPASQREALALHYLADLPVAEVAATLGVAVGTVKARLSRGRTALAAALDDAALVNGGPRG